MQVKISEDTASISIVLLIIKHTLPAKILILSVCLVPSLRQHFQTSRKMVACDQGGALHRRVSGKTQRIIFQFPLKIIK